MWPVVGQNASQDHHCENCNSYTADGGKCQWIPITKQTGRIPLTVWLLERVLSWEFSSCNLKNHLCHQPTDFSSFDMESSLFYGSEHCQSIVML